MVKLSHVSGPLSLMSLQTHFTGCWSRYEQCTSYHTRSTHSVPHVMKSAQVLVTSNSCHWIPEQWRVLHVCSALVPHIIKILQLTHVKDALCLVTSNSCHSARRDTDYACQFSTQSTHSLHYVVQILQLVHVNIILSNLVTSNSCHNARRDTRYACQFDTQATHYHTLSKYTQSDHFKPCQSLTNRTTQYLILNWSCQESVNHMSTPL